jgi:hypothetical protein
VSFEYTAAPEGIRVRTIMGSRQAEGILQWAFGAGAQAITPVGVEGGRFFEHRISWYVAPQAPRRTMGHPAEPSANPALALGIAQDNDTIFRCFHCHATAVAPGPKLDAMIPGVTCERCHGPAAAHAAKGTPLARKEFRRDDVLELCGSCHRLPMRPASQNPQDSDPVSIRFAPVGLTASACYRKSETLSCITCHDPHADAATSAAHYESKCTSCHNGQKGCPTENQNQCLQCHMPKRSPEPYLTFTDHRIRVYVKGNEGHGR